MLSFLGFVAATVIVAILVCIVVWFAMGAFHQHLKNKGEGLGDAATRTDLKNLEEKINAAFTTKH